jgi:hypothetical protein
MKNILIIVLASSLFFACVPKDKEIKINKFSENLVVNSQVIPNSIMLVSLTRSFSILSDGYITSNSESKDSINNDLMNKLLVSDAIVTVSYGSTIDTLFMVSPGLYASISTPQLYDLEYTIHAIDKTNKLEITATEKMLSQVKFNTTNFVYENGNLKFNYQFSDPAEINYYMVNIYRKNENKASGANNKDPNTFLSNGNTVVASAIFTDINFNGETQDRVLTIPNYEPVDAQDTMVVTLSNISEGFYNYLSLRNKVNKNILSQVFNEPINYPTNVQKGLGYFSTHFPDSKVMILPIKL